MEGNKLYVGNLSYDVTNDELQDLFSNHGSVKEVKIIEGRGFGFVEMSSPTEAESAKEALNGTEFKERTLKIDVARPQQNRSRGDFSRGKPRRNDRRY